MMQFYGSSKRHHAGGSKKKPENGIRNEVHFKFPGQPGCKTAAITWFLTPLVKNQTGACRTSGSAISRLRLTNGEQTCCNVIKVPPV
jgi:hypothetical protein